MKVLYFANFGNEPSNHIEEEIQSSLEKLGHEVIPVHERDFKKLSGIKADMLLFHKAGVGRYISIGDLVKILNHFTGKKVMWYLDKIFGEREKYVETVAEYIDYGFLVDDTWRRRHKYNNLYCLREGIGHNFDTQYPRDFGCDIAYVGSVYGEREEFVALLQRQYGNKFKVFNDFYEADLSSLHKAVKIIVAPRFPGDEFYWSSRFYLTLGSGGFLVHPDLYGLKEEFTEGKHFAGYKGYDEMFVTIDYFLEHEEERKSIRQQGYLRCREVATIDKRIETMLNTIWKTNILEG